MNKFMKIAFKEANKGMRGNESGPFGEVIVKDKKKILKANYYFCNNGGEQFRGRNDKKKRINNKNFNDLKANYYVSNNLGDVGNKIQVKKFRGIVKNFHTLFYPRKVSCKIMRMWEKFKIKKGIC